MLRETGGDKVNRRFVAHIVIAAFFGCLTGCASMTAENVGEGIAIGGIGSGSAGLTFLGGATEIIGGILSKPKKGSPEFEKRRAAIYKIEAAAYLKRDFYQPFIGEPSITPEQIQIAAQGYCVNVMKKVEDKESIPLSRKRMKESSVPEEYLPEGDGEIIEYTLDGDPFNGACVYALEAVGAEVVKSAKKQSVSTK